MALVLLDHGGQPVLFFKLLSAGIFAFDNPRANQRPVVSEAEIEQVVEIEPPDGRGGIADAEIRIPTERRRSYFAGDRWRKEAEVDRRVSWSCWIILAKARKCPRPL